MPDARASNSFVPGRRPDGAGLVVPFPERGPRRAPLTIVEDAPPDDRLPPGRARAVENENRSARTLDDADVRLVLALRVEGALEGGRAAILRPEARRRLVAAALDAGLRPFDANLLIAIVQEGARAGDAKETTRDRLRFIARRGVPGAPYRWLLLAATLLAAAMFWTLVTFFLRAPAGGR